MKKNILFFSVVLILAVTVFFGYRFYDNKINGEVEKDESARIIKKSELKNLGLDESQLGAVKKVKDIDPKEHVWGNLDAPVKMIVYTDFTCAYCEKYNSILEKVKAEFKDKVVIAYRNYIVAPNSPDAISAFMAAECAAEQDKYFQMQSELWQANKENKLGLDVFQKDALKIRLDIDKFNRCMGGSELKEKIEAETAAAKTYNVNGTPTTFINDEVIIGANPFEDTLASDGRRIEGLKSIISRNLNK